MIKGFADFQGTENYSRRFPEAFSNRFFRSQQNLFLSSIGLGTYLGDMDDRTDEIQYNSTAEAIRRGINVIDSAINYRAQRSERVIGKVIRDLAQSGFVRREELFLMTKGGFIPFDREYPEDPFRYFKENYLDSGILSAGDIAQNCHAMTPRYLEDQLERSLRNLGIETIDLYYVHNPEIQLEEISESEFYGRLTKS